MLVSHYVLKFLFKKNKFKDDIMFDPSQSLNMIEKLQL